MNRWRRRLALGLAFVATGIAFDKATDGIGNNPAAMLLYHGSGATVDLVMFRITGFFVSSHLQRDVEAICIASIAANALGLALYMAWTPPTIYDLLIEGLNYVLAIRLLMGDGDVLDLSYWRDLVRSTFPRRQNHATKEAQR